MKYFWKIWNIFKKQSRAILFWAVVILGIIFFGVAIYALGSILVELFTQGALI